MKRKMAPVYIGDVGDIITPSPKQPLPSGIDLDSLSLRELCNVAVSCGVDVRDLIGVHSCEEHYNKVELGGREMPPGFNLFDHCVYCKNCWKFFRQKSLE